MARFTGKNLYSKWTYSGGNVELADDFRAFDYDEEQEFADLTAGADEYRRQGKTVKNWMASMEVLATDVGGTADTLNAALKIGTSGTLEVGLAGTQSGKPKLEMICFISKKTVAAKFDDAVLWNLEFQTESTAYVADPATATY